MTSSVTEQRFPAELQLVQVGAVAFLLDEMSGCAQSLAAAMLDKQRVLVENRLTDLEGCAQAENELLGKLALLERQRHGACIALGAAMGLPDDRLSLDALLAELGSKAPEQVVEGLRSAAGRLTEQLANVAQLNTENTHLSANLLEYTRMILHALSHSGGQPGYGSDGKVGQDVPHELLSINA
jgi:flagellar biosynthesis/type III secretory pathway chaperone